MASKEIVDSILESIRDEVSEFVEKESKITSSLEYEEEVLRLSREFALKLISKGGQDLPKSRNSKKSPDGFRKDRVG